MIVSFFSRLLRLKLSYRYYGFALAFGLSSLIVPLGVQFLVNSLALSGLWFNTIAFILVIALGLALSQGIRHSQVLLLEGLQREIFLQEALRWKAGGAGEAPFFFEILNILKSFAKSYAGIIELTLVLFFGLITAAMFHPAFFFLAIFLVFAIWFVFRSNAPALKTSIEESNQKYDLFHDVHDGKGIDHESLLPYFKAREEHFFYVRRNSFLVSTIIVITQGVFLLVGCFLIQKNQLSIGQLVSVEIIIGGICSSLTKLPSQLEAVFDYETSVFKLNKTLTGGDNG